MNKLICEVLKTNVHKRKTDNTEYYSVTVLNTNNKVSVLFFKEKGLFDKFNNLDRLTAVNILGDFSPKDDTSFIFTPQALEI